MSSRSVKYAVILDAGSSGTRLYVYKWQEWKDGDSSPPAIESVYTYKEKGEGIAKLMAGSEVRYEAIERFEEALKAEANGLDGNKIQKAVEEMFQSKELQSRVDTHLKQYFEKAREFFGNSEDLCKQIPLFLLGTAGIRDLRTSEPYGKTKYADLLRYMKSSAQRAGFDMKECGAISGEAEALYGWIAANYSLGFFSGYGLRMSAAVGYVEMGGASVQIAFSPLKDDRPLDDDRRYTGKMWKVRIGSLIFDLFLGSYPLGTEVALDTYLQHLVRDNNSNPEKIIYDPGKPHGLEEEFGEWQLVGKLHYKTLKSRVLSVLQELKNDIAPSFDPALLDALQAHTFVGGANFWYSTREIFGLDINNEPKKTAFSFKEFKEEVIRTSQLHWKVLKERRPGVNEKFLAEAWFKAAWVRCVLTEFFEFDETKTPTLGLRMPVEDSLSFRPYNGADGMELTWTLGRIIHFATGNQPPAQMRGDIVRYLNRARAEAKEADRLARSSIESGLEHLYEMRNHGVPGTTSAAGAKSLIPGGNGPEAQGQAKKFFDEAGMLASLAILRNDKADKTEQEEVMAGGNVSMIDQYKGSA